MDSTPRTSGLLTPSGLEPEGPVPPRLGLETACKEQALLLLLARAAPPQPVLSRGCASVVPSAFVLDDRPFCSFFGGDRISDIPSFLSVFLLQGQTLDTCGNAEGVSSASRTADLLTATRLWFSRPTYQL